MKSADPAIEVNRPNIYLTLEVKKWKKSTIMSTNWLYIHLGSAVGLLMQPWAV